MKKFATLFILLFGTLQFVGAQTTEGHITYKIELSSDNPEMQMISAMANGSTMDLYFNKAKSRSEMKVGVFMNTTTIMDLDTKKMLTLTSGMMGKNAILGTVPENDEQTKAEQDSSKLKVTLTSETKEIIGLKAKKAIIATEDGKTVDFWYTDDIKVDLKGQAMVKKTGIPGVLLEMVVDQGGFKMNFTAIAYESKLPKNNQLFSMEVPEGYTVREGEELMKMMMPMFGQ